MNTLVKKLVFSALSIAIAYLLPFLTGQIPEIGSMLSPMHIPILICGFMCGWQWGCAAGFIAPLLRSLTIGMPPLMPVAAAMAFELACYGAMTGLLYKYLPKKIPYVYASLIVSMIAGRLVWGAARYAIAGFTETQFTLAAFWAGSVVNAIPGIILHILIIPPIIIALKKARLIQNG